MNINKESYNGWLNHKIFPKGGNFQHIFYKHTKNAISTDTSHISLKQVDDIVNHTLKILDYKLASMVRTKSRNAALFSKQIVPVVMVLEVEKHKPAYLWSSGMSDVGTITEYGSPEPNQQKVNNKKLKLLLK